MLLSEIKLAPHIVWQAPEHIQEQCLKFCYYTEQGWEIILWEVCERVWQSFQTWSLQSLLYGVELSAQTLSNSQITDFPSHFYSVKRVERSCERENVRDWVFEVSCHLLLNSHLSPKCTSDLFHLCPLSLPPSFFFLIMVFEFGNNSANTVISKFKHYY